MEDKTPIFKSGHTVRLSMYLSVLIGVVITLITILFSAYIIFNIKNLSSSYESDVYKLRYSLSEVLIQALSLDKSRNDFSSTSSMINLMKNKQILKYVYVKDNNSGKILAGDESSARELTIKDLEKVQRTIKTIGDYTIHIGIPIESSTERYYHGFLQYIFNIMIAFIIIAIITSIFMASIISKPLKKLSIAAKEITEGNFDVDIEDSRFSEINDLVLSYKKMATQLNELYSSLESKVKQRTQELEQANHKLKETQAMMVHSEKMRSLGELVAGIAHEINNPVNFIHGNIMILQNYTDDLLNLIDVFEKNTQDLPEDKKAAITSLEKQIDLEFLRGDIKDLIKSCIEGTQRTKNIVLDLKNFSRMEEMVLTQFDIPKEIETTLNILNNKYKNRITVVKNYAPDVPKIEAYGGQINQVFMNILDNAQDAIEGEGTLTINLNKVGDNVKIEFIDTGKGIPPENIERVFDPFFTTKAVGKGTGLGMSISYRVINDHNGKIEVESAVGKGTKFTITLPINQRAEGEEQLIKE